MSSSIIPSSMNERALATASWARPADIAGRPFIKGAVWLGRAADPLETPVGVTDDRHVLVVAGSRTGKGVSFIVPNLAQWPGSIVVVDPKGENATITAARRGAGSTHCDGLEQNVFVFDPFRAAQVPDELRASFNPLDALNPDDEEAADEASRIADAIVVSQSKDDPYWDDQARTLIRGLILHVITAGHFEGDRSLVTVRRLITSGDAELQKMMATEGASPSALEALFAGMRVNPAFSGIVAGIGDTFGNLLEGASRTFNNILGVASTQTDFIDSMPMRRTLQTTTPGFSLAKLKTDPMGISIFLSLPQRFMNTQFRWLRMMVSMIITEIERVPGQPASGHPVLLLLDEFAGLKKLEVIENATAQIAGFGVKMVFVVQALTQLNSIYDKNWEIFIANAGTKMFFGIEDQFSRDYISKYLGETEITRTTHSNSQTRGTSHNTTTGTSESTGSSESWTGGGSLGGSISTGSSISSDIGFFWNTARSTSSNSGLSSSSGASWSSNSGTSSGRSSSQSTSIGESESETSGSTQGLHKRPLLTPDEVGRMFSRIDDPYHPAYPGLALIVPSGSPPTIVRRIQYFSDPLFKRCFEPNPNHPALNAPPLFLPHALHQSLLPPPGQRIEQEVIAYYGQESYDLVASYHAKLSYESPGAKLVARPVEVFVKDVLDRCAISAIIMTDYSHPTTAQGIAADKNTLGFLRKAIDHENLEHSTLFLKKQVQRQVLLDYKIEKRTITHRERLEYLWRFKSWPLSLIGVPVALSLLRKPVSMGLVYQVDLPISFVKAITILLFLAVGVWIVGRKWGAFAGLIVGLVFCLSTILIDRIPLS